MNNVDTLYKEGDRFSIFFPGWKAGCVLVKVEEKEADPSIRQIGVNKNRWGGSSLHNLFENKWTSVANSLL